MPKSTHTPIRMCIVCKTRFSQDILNRFFLDQATITRHKCNGRSFYICNECLKKDIKILKKPLGRYLKNLDKCNLKEILLNGERSDL